ncbi:distal tail protein Dit, partial [Faecalibaculum rodentium]
MTYQFVDTVRQTEMVGESMPDEAVRINGKWLENEVSGYRTLHVSGRELISTEINTNTIAGMNGEIFLNSRIPARVITVRYLLAAKSNFEFRQAFNQLCRLLQPAQVEVVFADEPDKYFIGTKSEIENPEPGSNIATGEFKIFCTDPFKYSTTEKAIPITGNTLTITNNGTV